MRKFFMSLFVLAGVFLGGTLSASANAASGLAVKPAIATTTAVDKVHWRGHRGFGLSIGFGSPYYYGGYYPRQRYYSNYNDNYYYQPRYYHRRHHHRHHFFRRHHGW